MKNTGKFFDIIGIYTIYYLIKNYKNITLNIKGAIPYLIISLMPITWFLVMANHTWFHFWFTWRNLIVFYIGTGIFLLKLFKIKGDNSNRIEEMELIEKEKGNEVK